VMQPITACAGRCGHAVASVRPCGHRHAIVIAAVHCSSNVQRVGFMRRVAVNSVCTRLRYRATSRRYDNRRVAASAIDIAISPNR